MKYSKQYTTTKDGACKHAINKLSFSFLNVILCICLILGTNLNTKAQDLNFESFGIKGGVNTFNIAGSEAGGTRALLGFHFGVFTSLKLGSNLSLNPELLYVLNHWDGPNSSNDITVYWTNLDLPVMLSLQLPQVAEGLSVHAGPQFDILLSAKNKGTASDGTDVDVDRSDVVKSTNLSVGVGAAYQRPVGIQFSIRYLLGLSQLGQDEAGTILSDVKTRSVQFSVAYSIFKNSQ